MKRTFKVVGKSEGSDWHTLPVLERFGCGDLLDLMQAYPSFRLFMAAREKLTPGEDCLEVKGMADEVVAVKSRGQIGLLDSGAVTILAKFSVKPPLQEMIPEPELRKFVLESDELLRNYEGGWLLKEFEATEQGRDEIITYNQYNLPSYSKIMKSGGNLDLVMECSERKFNCDFDMKRLPVLGEARVSPDGPAIPEPYTIPFDTIEQMKVHRYQVDHIRRTGRVARPTEVVARVKSRGRRVRAQGGEVAALVRMFIRGLVQGRLPREKEEPLPPYPVISQRLNAIWQQLPEGARGKRVEWSATDLKNAARGIWEDRVIRGCPFHRSLALHLSAAFGVSGETACALLLLDDLVKDNRALVLEVAKLVLNGQRLSLWQRLHAAGKLPGEADLLNAFPVLDKDSLAAVRNAEFLPGARLVTDRTELVRLFRRLGLVTADSESLSKLIAPGTDQPRSAPKNPATAGCLGSFVACILQPEFAAIRPPIDQVKTGLSAFGLSHHRYRKLCQERFIPHRLTNTSANRGQIRKMARALYMAPEPIIEMLIDK